ncbi:hypothetical protein ERJ70_09050 [Sediminibacillus dalangtanensis]|uniref:RNA polymerase subunit sigma n=1 Tax=Sediminibacillus dalangtanensis TaxID=2729421 RepID=A0ABX7VR91_9BACI|nr:hypothetical protein [Sediminibacillus dalangtanensis]QTM99437.1 hypothetical protein ERJ70_09050 [Sediminibacillus dalangtanensis]
MSWKSVEMQVALPRVQDAAKMQEQLQQRGQQTQELLAAAQQNLEEVKRKQVNHSVHKADVHNKEKKEKQFNAKDSQQKKKADEEKTDNNHPYLGRKIDFSG